MTDRFRGRIGETYFICWLIINKPQSNLHSGDAYPGPKGVPWMDVPRYYQNPNTTKNRRDESEKVNFVILVPVFYQNYTFNPCAKLTNQNHLWFLKLYDDQLHKLFCFSRTKNQSSREESRWPESPERWVHH